MRLQPAYPITTARLRLRPLTADDIPDLLAYRGDHEVCRYLPFEPMSEEVLAGRIAGDLGRREITAEGDAVTLGVERISDGRVVGDVVLFFRSERHAGGEIGYAFHPDVAGQGFATEACAAVLDLAYDDLGLHRVVANMDARNTASMRLAGRLGMRQEAHHVSSEMFKGEWTDLLVYAMLDEEWSARRTT
ncbi:MAG TPA: GNAT family protein [Frankiaceae bacterium]|jgi:RimJ/RimL family protein N-acetyltransferase|nr:GNAT family protein [Frankiaceae bacterium]